MPRVRGIGLYAFICTVLAAFLTAFYSWRLLFLTFHGESRADHHTLEHAHESPWVMLGPLVVLSIGASFSAGRWTPGSSAPTGSISGMARSSTGRRTM